LKIKRRNNSKDDGEDQEKDCEPPKKKYPKLSCDE
jgi:hypothetical protein